MLNLKRVQFPAGQAAVVACLLPHGQPLALAVATPGTGLGQSQGHWGLKRYLATKSCGGR